MTTIYLTTGSELSMCGMNGAAGTNGDRPKLQSCVSIVVDDVDGDCDNNSGGGQHYYSDSHHHHQFYIQHQTSAEGQQESSNNEVFDDNADARSDISQCSRGSRGSTSREESETRLQQIKDEVRHRRDEFARLLDEHEQVVRELRRIESSGELHSLVETSSSGRTEEAPSLGLKQEE
ncbi:uncharacterized protein LOC124338560 [Daphnia pulicaria]|uniref:uncharacterized protein LOC124338560 n=1 Tax=Daphnia pulicaria TaxID=35523 RepID=UPI001EECEA9E|nr:uncharacterized protein LOC124338560 [Daphnia pulicaria]